jgi:hypothetical protein
MKQVDIILNNSKTPDSSDQLSAFSLEIQNYLRSSEFSKFLVKDPQSIANRFGNPLFINKINGNYVDEEGEPLTEKEKGRILEPQKIRTLYLEVLLEGNKKFSHNSNEIYLKDDDSELLIFLDFKDLIKFKEGYIVFNGNDTIGTIDKIVNRGEGNYSKISMESDTNNMSNIVKPYLLITNPNLPMSIARRLQKNRGVLPSYIKDNDENVSTFKYLVNGIRDLNFSKLISEEEIEEFNKFSDIQKLSYGALKDDESVNKYIKLLNTILGSGWTDLFSPGLEGMTLKVVPFSPFEKGSINVEPSYNDCSGPPSECHLYKKLQITLIGNGELTNTVKRVKDLESKYYSKVQTGGVFSNEDFVRNLQEWNHAVDQQVKKTDETIAKVNELRQKVKNKKEAVEKNAKDLKKQQQEEAARQEIAKLDKEFNRLAENNPGMVVKDKYGRILIRSKEEAQAARKASDALHPASAVPHLKEEVLDQQYRRPVDDKQKKKNIVNIELLIQELINKVEEIRNKKNFK